MPHTIVQLVHIDETGDSYYRMRWPARDLTAQDSGLRVINLDARSPKRYEWALNADLLVAYQTHDVDLLPIIRKRKAAGRKTLVEYNDNFYAPQAWSPVAKEWASPLVWQSYELFMRECDGIIVTGPGLEQLFKEKFPDRRITVLENHYPKAITPFEATALKKKAPVTIGWAGSLGHMADFLAVLPTLRELLVQFPNAILSVMGNESIPEYLHLPKERFRYTPWGTMDQYFSFWSGVHIGIAPLNDTPYNRCRSDIKAVEMGALAVAPVLPDALPYQKFLEATGIPPVHSYEDLKGQIAGLLHDGTRRLERAEKAWRYVAENRIGPAHQERLTLYREFLPKEESSFSFGLPPGYHEVRDTADSTSPSHKALARAQDLSKQQKLPDAIEQLESAWQENPLHADLGFSLIRALSAAKNSRATIVLTECRQRFPNDLRFTLLYLSMPVAATEARDLWEQVLNYLHSAPAPVKIFFAHEATRLMARTVRAAPDFSVLGERLLELYPNAIELHLALGETLEKAGLYDMSLGHFSVVEKLIEAFIPNAPALQGISLGFVKAWRETLEYRLKR